MKRLFMLAMACAILTGVFAQEEKPTCLHQVRFWHGSEDDSRDTKVFTITSAVWRVWWATERGRYGAANFQIYVNSEDGEFVDLAANLIGKSNHWRTIRKKGRFYLQVVTGQPYMITVYQERAYE